MPVTVTGGERGFSKRKIIKNYLRSTVCQDRLISLAILSKENQLARKCHFKDIINKKARSWALGAV
jgi:hypothetical protein